MIEIYTDGACMGNPGPGGWAAIILENGSRSELHGSQDDTTNNRMELLAAIKGLEALPESVEATVFSDSEYLVKTMTKNWKRNANTDLWALLDSETRKRQVKWRWIRGHDGNPLNEEADALAYKQASGDRSEESDSEGVSETPSSTHIDQSGKAQMVDVGRKSETQRMAVATGCIVMRPETLTMVRSNSLQKGDIFGVARIAGIMAAKNTSDLIPLCHPIPVDQVKVEFEPQDHDNAVIITAVSKTTAKTGVEMEAMMAVSIAALTIYDMCKSVDRSMRIENIRLVSKSGGESGDIIL